MKMKSNEKVRYVVKMNGVVKMDTHISKIADYESVTGIEYNYDSLAKIVNVTIYSDVEIPDSVRLISMVTNHASMGTEDIRIRVVPTSLFRRLLGSFLDLEMDAHGSILRIHQGSLRVG